VRTEAEGCWAGPQAVEAGLPVLEAEVVDALQFDLRVADAQLVRCGNARGCLLQPSLGMRNIESVAMELSDPLTRHDGATGARSARKQKTHGWTGRCGGDACHLSAPAAPSDPPRQTPVDSRD